MPRGKYKRKNTRKARPTEPQTVTREYAEREYQLGVDNGKQQVKNELSQQLAQVNIDAVKAMASALDSMVHAVMTINGQL